MINERRRISEDNFPIFLTCEDYSAFDSDLDSRVPLTERIFDVHAERN